MHVARVGIWESVFLQDPAVDSNCQVVQNIYHDTSCALTLKLCSANRTVLQYLFA